MQRKTSLFACTFIFLSVIGFSVLLYINDDQSEQFTSERGIAHTREKNHIIIDLIEDKDTWPLKENIKIGVILSSPLFINNLTRSEITKILDSTESWLIEQVGEYLHTEHIGINVYLPLLDDVELYENEFNYQGFSVYIVGCMDPIEPLSSINCASIEAVNDGVEFITLIDLNELQFERERPLWLLESIKTVANEHAGPNWVAGTNNYRISGR